MSTFLDVNKSIVLCVLQNNVHLYLYMNKRKDKRKNFLYKHISVLEFCQDKCGDFIL